MQKIVIAAGALLATTSIYAIAQEAPAPSREGGFGLGREALPEEIAAWDIDIRPDGQGLPVGEGDVWTGEEAYVTYCSACHGDFGEAVGRWPMLSGGFGSLHGEDPVKTVGSYWPYLSTVWDYVHRAMPYGAAQSLTDDEVYAITAYLLYLNNVVDDDFTLSNENFAEIALENEGGFFMDDRDEVEIPVLSQEPCMTDCAESVEITMRAAVLDVTPETEEDAVEEEAAATVEEAAPAGPDPELVAAGEAVYRACAACHEIGEGARNRVGPALNDTYGNTVAHVEGFRYSPALREAGESGMVWNSETLSAYLADPRGYIRGNRMAFQGLRSDEDIAAVIAYMQAEGGVVE
jgi:cytochrome c